MIYIYGVNRNKRVIGSFMVKVNKLFGEDTHLSDEALALYVDALILNKVYLLPGALLGHVDDCQKCKSEIVEALSLVEEQAYGAKGPHPYLGKKVESTPARFSLFYRMAAVFLIGISLAFFFYFFRPMKDDHTAVIDSIRSMQIAHPEIRKSPIKEGDEVNQQKNLADNFSASPNLENLVNSVSRSESPLIISPKNNADVGREILFEWKVQEVGSVRFTIFSNREEVLKAITLNKTKLVFSGKLDPGLYYWKLERKDELLYIGKFFVR